MDGDLEILHSRVTNIFTFIKALNEIRNPITMDIVDQFWLLWFDNLPIHDNIVCNSNIENKDAITILKVARPLLKECPTPEESIKNWLKPGWNYVENTPEIILQKREFDGNNEIITVNFEDDPERQISLIKWLEKRNLWVEKEIPARQVMDTFNHLYKLYAILQKESETKELILGDGLLNWSTDNYCINHPILIQRVELIFDLKIPEFQIKLLDGQTEIYLALLRGIEHINTKELRRLIEELETNNYQLDDGANIDSFLKKLVVVLRHTGEFVGINKPKGTVNKPEIGRAKCLYLRKRNHGFSSFIDSILKDISENKQLPPFLEKVVGAKTDRPEIYEENDIVVNPNGEDEDILLCKQANLEQLLVMKHLSRTGAVLVQGPPGTGKTYTIANIIGHLLSQGKSILVTSHSDKALSVLKEKVVEPLQPLCLSLVRSHKNISEMDITIDELNEKRSTLEKHTLEIEIGRLETKRKNILKALREKREELKIARMNEYLPIVTTGMEFSPSNAAKYIFQNKDTDSWIPSPVLKGEPLPITKEELIKLYKTNEILSKEDEMECYYKLPDTNELLIPDSFRLLVSTVKTLSESNLDYGKELWTGEKNDNTKLNYIINKLIDIKSQIILENIFQLDIIESSLHIEKKRPWLNLIEEIETLYKLSISAKETFLCYAPFIKPEKVSDNTLKEISEIIEYLQMSNKNQIGVLKLLIKPKWKEIISDSQVNNTYPLSQMDFHAIYSYLLIQLKRKSLIQRWNRQLSEFGLNTSDILHEDIEEYAIRQVPFIQKNLDWYENEWLTLINELIAENFLWEVFESQFDYSLVKYGKIITIHNQLIDSLIQTINSRMNRNLYNQYQEDLLNLKKTISRYIFQKEEKINIIEEIIHAIDRLDPEVYSFLYDRFITINKLKSILEERNLLLHKMRGIAPEWARMIQNRETIHADSKLPGNADKAWVWRQLIDELDYRNQLDIRDILDSIHELDTQLRHITTILVDKKAWKQKVAKITTSQLQAIEGWRSTMKNIGAGTGKGVPFLLAEARKLMLKCQSAIPVWIMPLSRVAENFDPSVNKFDVVIIDEASQADITALCAVYLGNQIIIVGDDEQVSPVAIGEKWEDIQALIDTYLEGIPNRHLYTGKFSIYDLAQTSGFQPVCLREHFRCIMPIIQFSNYLSYQGKIKPLRDDSNVITLPATVAYRVEGAQSLNKTNLLEARTLVSLLIACTEMEEYKGKTFGVITLLGDSQALIIDELLQKFMEPKEYVNRKIQCGNPAHFQGDERDIVFLSMVDCNEGEGPLTLRDYDTNKIFKQRYNVAASRACDQLWVIYSLNPDIDLKSRDIRLRLIKHAQDPFAIENTLEQLKKETGSVFEEQVIKILLEAGYKVVPQWKVGAYRIDIVVEGGGKRLAIECDGEQWHKYEDLDNDMKRQAILERLGWKFERIRGSSFFRDSNTAMKKVFERLKELGIEPEFFSNLEIGERKTDLVNRVTKRAADLRIEWGWVENKFYDLNDGEKQTYDNMNPTPENSKGKSEDSEFSTEKIKINKHKKETVLEENEPKASERSIIDFRGKTTTKNKPSSNMVGVLDFRKRE